MGLFLIPVGSALGDADVLQQQMRGIDNRHRTIECLAQASDRISDMLRESIDEIQERRKRRLEREHESEERRKDRRMYTKFAFLGFAAFIFVIYAMSKKQEEEE